MENTKWKTYFECSNQKGIWIKHHLDKSYTFEIEFTSTPLEMERI